MLFHGMEALSQARPQSTVISASTPGQPIAGFETGENTWDFNNTEWMDIAELWTINSEVGTTGMTGQLQDTQPQNSGYAGNVHRLHSQRHPDASRLPAILDMRDIWFTTIQRSKENDPPIRTSVFQSHSSPGGLEMIDEEYRRSLTKALIRPFPEEDLLPCSDLLVSGVFSEAHTTDPF